MEEMTSAQIEQAIQQARLAILGLARGDHAYAFPLLFAHRDGIFYWHSHPGEKDEFIQATEEACLTIVTARTEDDWESVMAFGHAEAIHQAEEQAQAREILATVPPPPEVGTSKTGEPLRSEDNVTYWRLDPTRITGRKSQRAPPDTSDVA